MDKFIIFKLKDVTVAGASVSDDGTGIEIISLPVKSISHMTASTGKVNIFFKDVSRYDESNLSTGESMQKSFVTISCPDGEEFTTIESIANFSGLLDGSRALVFDAEVVGDISAVVKSHPVNRVTGKASVVTDSGFTAVTSNTVNDINFGVVDHKPILDLDYRDAVFGGGGSTISAWANAGTGGSTYDYSSATGTVTALSGNIKSGFSQEIDTVRFLSNSYISLAAELTVTGEYTMYMVYSTGTDATGKTPPIIYGVDAGDTSGGIGLTSSLLDGLTPPTQDKIGIQYQERYGEPIKSDVLVPLDDVTPCVLVIRRDKDFNVFIYNASGDLVVAVPANVYIAPRGPQNVAAGETSGDLSVLHIGSANENTTDSFNGRLGRFGVIDKDIGSVEAQRIALALYDLYSF